MAILLVLVQISDLQAAMDNKIDVVEVTYCNSRSVAEHIVMMILSLVRDYHNQHHIVKQGGWNIADGFIDLMMLKVCILEQLLRDVLD